MPWLTAQGLATSLLLTVFILTPQENSLIGPTRVPCSRRTQERHSWGSWSGERSEFRKRITKFPVRGTGSEKTQIDVLLAPCLPRENSPEPRLAHL